LNATEWNNLSSGLLGAVIGAVIGSLVGFLGSMFLNWQNDRSKCKAAGRALLAEVSRNYQALAYVGDHRPAGYSEVVWETQLPLIAQLLKWEELRVVAEPYIDASEPLSGFELADELRSRGEVRRLNAGEGSRSLLPMLVAGQFDRNAEEVLKKCQEELAKVRNKFDAAAEVLRRRVLTEEESRNFPRPLAKAPAGAKSDGNTTPSI
jgi:gas vesicle protein